MMMLSKIRLTKLGKFIFAIGCLFPIGIAILVPLLLLGGIKIREIDEKWINEEITAPFIPYISKYFESNFMKI